LKPRLPSLALIVLLHKLGYVWIANRGYENAMSSNKVKYILAVDLGTSGPKSALVSTWGEVADFEFKENQVLLLPKGGAEQRPDEWWDTILYTAKKVLAKQLVPVDDIVAICCSTHHLAGRPGQSVYQAHHRRVG
jgi:hypothetical protein